MSILYRVLVDGSIERKNIVSQYLARFLGQEILNRKFVALSAGTARARWNVSLWVAVADARRFGRMPFPKQAARPTLAENQASNTELGGGGGTSNSCAVV